MKTLVTITVLAAVGLSVAAPFWFHHRAAVAAAAVEKANYAQTEEIARLSTNHARPSPAPVQVSAPVLSPDQLTELARLRNELGRLRAAVKETRQLRVEVAEAEAKKPAPIPAGPNYWPTGELVYAGYSSPESTLKTALWEIKSGDMKGLLTCLSPEILAVMQQQSQKDGLSPEQMESQFKEIGSAMISGSSGFRLVGQTNEAPDETTLCVSDDDLGLAQNFKFKKIGPEWKIQQATDAHLEDPAW